MATVKELKDILDGISAEVETTNAAIIDIGTEVDKIAVEIQKLQESISNTPLPAEVAESIERLKTAVGTAKASVDVAKASAQKADDLNPDA